MLPKILVALQYLSVCVRGSEGNVVYLNVNAYVYVNACVWRHITLSSNLRKQGAPSSWELKGSSWIPSFFCFFYGVVKFLTLIKKNGEAWGVRSSNESMFMHLEGSGCGGNQVAPFFLQTYCWDGAWLSLNNVWHSNSHSSPLLCPTVEALSRHHLPMYCSACHSLLPVKGSKLEKSLKKKKRRCY